VRRGYAASLVRPGGNTTGAFLDTPEIVRKWLEVLKASIPQLARVAVIWDDCMGSGAYLTVSGLGGSLRSSNHTTTQVSPCLSSRPEVTISVTALFKLSQWCLRRLGDHAGEMPCLSSLTLPPANSLAPASSHACFCLDSSATVGDVTDTESTTSESDRRSGHCSASPVDRQGGA
jgi:hypothetical protein